MDGSVLSTYTQTSLDRSGHRLTVFGDQLGNSYRMIQMWGINPALYNLGWGTGCGIPGYTLVTPATPGEADLCPIDMWGNCLRCRGLVLVETLENWSLNL